MSNTCPHMHQQLRYNGQNWPVYSTSGANGLESDLHLNRDIENQPVFLARQVVDKEKLIIQTPHHMHDRLSVTQECTQQYPLQIFSVAALILATCLVNPDDSSEIMGVIALPVIFMLINVFICSVIGDTFSSRAKQYKSMCKSIQRGLTELSFFCLHVGAWNACLLQVVNYPFDPRIVTHPEGVSDICTIRKIDDRPPSCGQNFILEQVTCPNMTISRGFSALTAATQDTWRINPAGLTLLVRAFLGLLPALLSAAWSFRAKHPFQYLQKLIRAFSFGITGGLLSAQAVMMQRSERHPILSHGIPTLLLHSLAVNIILWGQNGGQFTKSFFLDYIYCRMIVKKVTRRSARSQRQRYQISAKFLTIRFIASIVSFFQYPYIFSLYHSVISGFPVGTFGIATREATLSVGMSQACTIKIFKDSSCPPAYISQAVLAHEKTHAYNMQILEPWLYILRDPEFQSTTLQYIMSVYSQFMPQRNLRPIYSFLQHGYLEFHAVLHAIGIIAVSSMQQGILTVGSNTQLGDCYESLQLQPTEALAEAGATEYIRHLYDCQ